ncbi:radiation sensitive protein rad9 [Ophidiomyces ophidiicola]|nr:radiation sensitive protein rad9 [Ophidiomyces ophidiicola]
MLNHDTLQHNVMVAVGMPRTSDMLYRDALPQFSYQQNGSTSGSHQFHTETWKMPKFPTRAAVPPESTPGDTQPLSQSAYANVLKQQTREVEPPPPRPRDEPDIDPGVTQNTVTEGDTGHLDLLVDLDDTTLAIDEDDTVSGSGDEASSPVTYRPFPESQRFAPKTPHSQHVITLTDATAITPALSRNPFTQGTKTPGSVMALSQLFNATQDPSSPVPNLPRLELSSDMPSPHLPIQSRQTTTTTLFSPLLATSSINPRFVEPQTNYVSMQESQDVRKNAAGHQSSPSTSNHSSDGFSDDDFISNEQRQIRQNDTEIHLRKQLEYATISERGFSRKLPQKSHSLPLSTTTLTINNTKPALSADNMSVVMRSCSDAQQESEFETDQEDENAISKSLSTHVSHGDVDDDKENVDSTHIHDPNATTLPDERSSQALPELKADSSENQVIQFATQKSQPLVSPILLTLASASEDSLSERVLNSQPSIEDINSPLHKSVSFSDGAFGCFSPPQKPICRPLELLDCLRPEFQPGPIAPIHPSDSGLHTLPDNTANALHCTNSDSMRKGCTQIPKQHFSSSNNQVLRLNNLKDPQSQNTPQESNSARIATPMASLVFETPTAKSSKVKNPPNTIPDTSPNDQHIPCSTPFQNRPKSEGHQSSPESESCLPIMPHYYSQNGRRRKGVDWPQKDVSHQFLSVLSSPSGRQRRSMTDIASDKSPQKTASDIVFEDINPITADDENFQATIMNSENKVMKRRKANSGRGVPVSSRIAIPRFSRHIDIEPAPFPTKPHYHFPPDSAFQLSLNTSGLDSTTKSIWDVAISPERKTPGSECHAKCQTAVRASVVAKPSNKKKAYSVAHAVVIHHKSSSSPCLADKSTSDFPTVNNSPIAQCVAQNESIKHYRLDFRNQVFAFYNGQPHGYYPATCIGVSNDIDRERYLVLFEDSETPDKLEANSVKKLELFVNDTVKVFSPGIPKIPYRVVGLVDKLDTGTSQESTRLTDIHGHSSVVLIPKQERRSGNEYTITVPISHVYLDKNLWSRLGKRPYTFNASQEDNQALRSETPINGMLAAIGPTLFRTPKKEVLASGIFNGMAFAISYTHDGRELARLEQVISTNGGQILKEGFDELFELPSHSTGAETGYALRLTPRAEQFGFVCLITDNYSRRPKYMQALALSLPCLAGRWVDHCVKKGEIVNWQPYLLAAGPSMVLQAAVKSRVIPYYAAATARLSRTISERRKPFAGQTVYLVMSRGNVTEQKRAYSFFTYALGPDAIHHVQDIQAVIHQLKRSGETSQNAKYDTLASPVWIYIGDGEAVNASRKLLTSSFKPLVPKIGSFQRRGRPPKKRKINLAIDDEEAVPDMDEYQVNGMKVRILDNEYLCQVLIFGDLFDGWPAIRQEVS